MSESTMGPVEKLLRAAGELITPDDARCTGPTAMDQYGMTVSPSDPTACRWCANGALYKAAVEGSHSSAFFEAGSLLDGAAEFYGHATYIHANENTGAALTPDVYSLAIEAAAELGL